MVYAGETIVKGWPSDGLNIYGQGFDADDEEKIIDIKDYPEYFDKGRPKNASIFLDAEHATEVVDIVSAKLFASIDGIVYTELAEITDADLANANTTTSTSAVVQATAWTLPYQFFKLITPTVGAGNTLNIHAILNS